jgi:hypothetical protein
MVALEGWTGVGRVVLVVTQSPSVALSTLARVWVPSCHAFSMAAARADRRWEHELVLLEASSVHSSSDQRPWAAGPWMCAAQQALSSQPALSQPSGQPAGSSWVSPNVHCQLWPWHRPAVSHRLRNLICKHFNCATNSWMPHHHCLLYSLSISEPEVQKFWTLTYHTWKIPHLTSHHGHRQSTDTLKILCKVSFRLWVWGACETNGFHP